jgi:hypothetical protein
MSVATAPAPAAEAAPAAPRRSVRRKVVALTVAGLGIAGLGLASAAQLNLTAGALGAGTTVVASCDSNGVAVAFTNAFTASVKGYTVSQVTLSDVAAGCQGQTIAIDLLNTDPADGSTGASISHLTGTVPQGGGSVSLAVTGAVKAADVKGVAVVIAG